MTTDEFWKIIELAREKGEDCESVAGAIGHQLEAASIEEVLGFERELQQRMAESYRWDLWAVAYIVNGGCSDDGFEYFRGWLISQGRSYFEAALAEPERAADAAEPDANECEDMLYVAASIHKAKKGVYPPKTDVPRPANPAGAPWEEDDLESLYPELWERFT